MNQQNGRNHASTGIKIAFHAQHWPSRYIVKIPERYFVYYIPFLPVSPNVSLPVVGKFECRTVLFPLRTQLHRTSLSKQTDTESDDERERETERNGENSQVRTTNTWSSFTSERALGQRMPLPRNWMIHMPGRKVVTLGRWATISVKHVSGCQGTTFLIHLDSS